MVLHSKTHSSAQHEYAGFRWSLHKIGSGALGLKCTEVYEILLILKLLGLPFVWSLRYTEPRRFNQCYWKISNCIHDYSFCSLMEKCLVKIWCRSFLFFFICRTKVPMISNVFVNHYLMSVHVYPSCCQQFLEMHQDKQIYLCIHFNKCIDIPLSILVWTQAFNLCTINSLL